MDKEHKDEKIVENTDVIKQDNAEKELSLVSDESLMNVYDEIMGNLRKDRDQVSDLVDAFSNMVLNDGDPSSASKEALVNLLKTKIEASDKMTRIADLMTRIKLKQPDTYSPWMNKGKKDAGHTINIYDSSGINRKSLMEKIQKEKETNEA